MDLGISGKTALVFGGGGGLGGAIAHSLAGEGARVVVADLNGEAAQRTVDSIESAGGSATAIVWDLGDLGVIDSNITHIEVDRRPGRHPGQQHRRSTADAGPRPGLAALGR